QDLTRLGPVTGPDDAVLLHEVDEAGRLRVAEPHPSLDEADRRLLLTHDQLDGAPVDVVALRLAAASVHAALLADRLHEAFLEHRLALLLEEAHHLADLRLRDPRAVDADRARRAGRHEEHVAAADQLLGAVLIEDRA